MQIVNFIANNVFKYCHKSNLVVDALLVNKINDYSITFHIPDMNKCTSTMTKHGWSGQVLVEYGHDITMTRI